MAKNTEACFKLNYTIRALRALIGKALNKFLPHPTADPPATGSLHVSGFYEV